MKTQQFNCAQGCSVEATLQIIGGKWKGVILYRLMEKGILRFSELKRQLPSITQRSLTTQLRELEKDHIITRTVYPEVPPRVEYQMTPYGQTLEPILLALKTWGDDNLMRR